MQIGFGFLSTGSLGLIISSIIADLLASVNLLRVFFQIIKRQTHKFSWSRTKQLAYEYRDFPIYSRFKKYNQRFVYGFGPFNYLQIISALRLQEHMHCGTDTISPNGFDLKSP
jgi:uncharacterized membrane protein